MSAMQFAVATLVAVAMCVVGQPVAHADIAPSARLDLDQAWHRNAVIPFDDAFLVRRARLGIEGKFDNAWSFEVDYDFVGDGEFKDAALTYEGWDAGELAVGQFKVPFGLEAVTSSRNILFLERALPVDALGLSRRLGIGFDHKGKHYTMAVMGFSRSIDEDDGRGVAGRITYAPVNTDYALLHLGAAVASVTPHQGVARFRARPESKPTDVRLVDTGKLSGVDRVDRLGLELAWQLGPFTAQGEWMQADVVGATGVAQQFGGWYLAGSVMLNGGRRRYEDGKFKSPLRADRLATWELTARYSRLDLDAAAVAGGGERNLALGLNAYVGEHFRVGLNYIDVQSDRRGMTRNPDILLLRTEFFF